MDHLNKIYQSGSSNNNSDKYVNKGIEKGLIKSACLKCGRQYKTETKICQKCLSRTTSF